MRVLITGATGSVGREVLSRLQREGADVVASTRNPSTASLPAGVPSRAVDLAESQTLRAALKGIDAVYVFPFFDDPQGVAEALAASKVQRVVLLSSISTSLPDADSQFNASRFLRLERAIESTGLAFTFLRAGEFAGNIRSYAPGLAEGKVEVPFLHSQHLPLDERDIAEVASIALTSDRLAGEKPRLTGEQLVTLREEIELVGEAAGRRIDVVELSEESAQEHFAPKAPRPLVKTMLGMWKHSIDHPPEASPMVREITGRAPGAFADWARHHAEEFRGGSAPRTTT